MAMEFKLSYTGNQVNEKLAKIDSLAEKSEIPTKTSDLINDAKYVNSSQLSSAVDTALADAKANGEFDGTNGSVWFSGTVILDGISPTSKIPNAVNGDYYLNTNTGGIYKAIDGYWVYQGNIKGQDGASGTDGISATHSWDGTTLTITSASGTSSADLKGETGKDGTSVTVSNVSESTTDEGNNIVTFSDGKAITIKNGSKGTAGADGTKWYSGTAVTADNTPMLAVSGAKVGDYYLNTSTYNYYLAGSAGVWVKQGCLKGSTPVKGTDYWTSADKAEVVNEAVTEVAKSVTVPTKLSELSGDSTHRVVTDAEKTAWNAKSDFSGKYADLSGKPTIPTIPTKVSAFDNDKGYITNEEMQTYINETFLGGAW